LFWQCHFLIQKNDGVMSIELKSKIEIQKMRAVNLLVFEIHQALAEKVVVGVTTAELDSLASSLCAKAGAVPAFLNYPSNAKNIPAFPGVICASANEAIVHGIPNDTPLVEGDILSIDFGCELGGFFGDSAYTYAIGKVSEKAEKLLRVTAQSLELAIAKCCPGNRLGDISNAVQSYVEKDGFGVVREFVGHGIGRKMHEQPPIPNWGKPNQGRVLRPGMVLAIEPMITEGDFNVKILSDGWTAVTMDGSLSAHFEHTVAVTDSGPFVLSRP
jgi:methionyl aminopeptidase